MSKWNGSLTAPLSVLLRESWSIFSQFSADELIKVDKSALEFERDTDVSFEGQQVHLQVFGEDSFYELEDYVEWVKRLKTCSIYVNHSDTATKNDYKLVEKVEKAAKKHYAVLLELTEEGNKRLKIASKEW